MEETGWLELLIGWLPMVVILLALFAYARYGGSKYAAMADLQRQAIDAVKENTLALKQLSDRYSAHLAKLEDNKKQ